MLHAVLGGADVRGVVETTEQVIGGTFKPAFCY